jgi:uncharacterized membrane protein YvlD (DUF360 family)
MGVLIWLIRFLIPGVVLYTIGYFVPGFSALSFWWLLWLGGIIAIGNWLIFRVLGVRRRATVKFILNFLVATVVIFTMTSGIEGGQVPLGGSLLAALLISLLQTMVPDLRNLRRRG